MKARGREGSVGRIKNFIGGVIGSTETLDIQAHWITNLGHLGTTAQSSEKVRIHSSIFGNAVSGGVFGLKAEGSLTSAHLNMETDVFSNLGSVQGDILNLKTSERFYQHKGETQFYGALEYVDGVLCWIEKDTPQPVLADSRIDITQEGNFSLTGSSKNRGTISGQGKMKVDGVGNWFSGDNLLENDGVISSESTIDVLLGNIINRGRISSSRLALNAQSIVNIGTIKGQQYLGMSVSDLINYPKC